MPEKAELTASWGRHSPHRHRPWRA